MRKTKKQIVRERRAIVACAGLLTAAAVFGFARVNSCAKDFEARAEASKTSSVGVVTVAARPQQTAAPAPILYDVPLGEQLQLYIIAECEKRGIDPAVVVAIIQRESRYTANAIGDNGNSIGLCQIQPRWHSDRMERLGVTDLLDPVSNVRVAIDYLDELLDRYDVDYAKALVAYNQGSFKGTVTEYANAVLDIAEELKGGAM